MDRNEKLYDVNLADDSRHWPDWTRALDTICSTIHWTIQDRDGTHMLVRTAGEMDRDHYPVRDTTYGEWADRHPKHFGSGPEPVAAGYERKPAPEAGDLVVVELVRPNHPLPIRQSARVLRVVPGNPTCYVVKLVGLRVQSPYVLGMTFPLAADKVIDWE